MVDGHPDEAIADFSAALVLDPKSAGALNNRGLAYRKKGDLDRAIADYTAAITINPLYALAFNNRGYVYEAKGQKPQAIADFRQALLFDPTLSGAKDGLTASRRGGQFDRRERGICTKRQKACREELQLVSRHREQWRES